MTRHNELELNRRAVMKLGVGTAAVATAGVGLPADEAFARELAPARGPALGAALSRADGPLKVAGLARYAIEQKLDNMVYGVTVQSTRPAGRIVGVDTSAAKAMPGVVDVYTLHNPLKLNKPTVYSKGGGATEEFTPLQDDVVRFNGMHLALVVAETLEQATEAASLLKVTYEDAEPILDLDDPKAKPQTIAGMGAAWGDAPAGLASAEVKVDVTYTTAREYNVPLEPHACIASWDNGTLYSRAVV
jgi:xanthine dehydrogenase YagR molybdenum-binding subunit